MSHLKGGPRILVKYAIWLEGTMPHSPIEFKTLPWKVREEFGADEDGYLPAGADWYALAKESKGWNSDGLYDLIDVQRII